VKYHLCLKYLLDQNALTSKFSFEEWASNHWANMVPHYERARLKLRALERLGVASEALEAERAHLAAWGAQVVEATPLAASHPEEPSLDYSEPVTLKYFCVWLWLNDHAPTNEEATRVYSKAMSADDGPARLGQVLRARSTQPARLQLPRLSLKYLKSPPLELSARAFCCLPVKIAAQ
jgi:hypothetical protein